MNSDSYKIIISLSHHRIAFEYWQRDGEDKLVPMSGMVWPAPLAFYCSLTGIEIGEAAVRAVHAGTPNAFDNYFERLTADETYTIGGRRKALRYLILDASEGIFTEFFRTELLGHQGSLTDNRATMPITMVCESDIKPNERALLLNLFRDSGYNRFKVVDYTDYIDRYLRSTLSKEYSCENVLVAWTEGTDLTLTLFDLTKTVEPRKTKFPGLGADPRLDYVKKLIWERICGQNPWLRFTDEEDVVTKEATDFLNSSIPIINATLTLSDGMNYHYSLNRAVIDHLQCPEGDIIRMKLEEFLHENGISNRNKTLLLLRGVAAGNMFFEKTLGQGFGKIIKSDKQLRNNTMYQLITEPNEGLQQAPEPTSPGPTPPNPNELLKMRREMRAARANIKAKYGRGDRTGASRIYRDLLEGWEKGAPAELQDELNEWLKSNGISLEVLLKAEEPVKCKKTEPMPSKRPEPKPESLRQAKPESPRKPEPDRQSEAIRTQKPSKPDLSEGDVLLKKGEFNAAKRYFAGVGDESRKQLCIDLLRDSRDLKAISGQNASSLSPVARANNLDKLKRILTNYRKGGQDTTKITELINKYR